MQMHSNTTFKMTLGKWPAVLLNSAVFMFFILVILNKVKKGMLDSEIPIISLGVGITLMSLIGFFIRNGLGWLLTVFPVFLAFSFFALYIIPNGILPESTSIVVVLGFNFFLAFFNSSPYQQSFRLKGKELLLMNVLALISGIVLSYVVFLKI